LETFVRGSDGAVYHRWQAAPNADWSGWSTLDTLGGQIASDPVVGRTVDGRLQVFVVTRDSTLWSRWQVVPNGGWS
jgi:hypothetical protein